MNLLYALDLLGTAAFAASGALVGVRRQMDLFGVLVLGLVTAIGGGTLRDLLLGAIPPFSLQDETYLYISIGVALLTFVGHRRIEELAHPLLYLDAVGLATFVVIGTEKAMAFGSGFLGAVTLGVMTATAGGVLRDVLSNQVPLILQREIYASACFAGAALLYLLKLLHWPRPLAVLLAAALVIGLRLLAIRHNWALPRAGQPESSSQQD
ncbi:trimeric intracellular cation channel family protein [Desulfuromonas thiophila]|uniref:trimeric intracellular cation channel family protein n=1 Tax=Desulfuromonas thiophila TaxID=57664 RepID=UPI0024A93DB4|nr:trimeric intracellular cation channel family protein [Desulfuromonas thiophila]